jgi:hypothetical protein
MVKLLEGEHYYYDEKGRMVLTEKYLKARGYCCGNGCKHCPYSEAEFEAAKAAKPTFRSLLFGRK